MPHAAPPERDASWPGCKLFVNDGALDQAEIAPLIPSSPGEPIEELRKKYDENGYVFLKGLLAKEDVLKCRENYFSMMSPSGVLKPDTKPVEGIFDASKDKSNYPGIGAGAVGGNGRPGEDTAEQFVNLALKAHYEDWCMFFFFLEAIVNLRIRLMAFQTARTSSGTQSSMIL